MKVVGISDTHNRHKDIKVLREDSLGGDIIIHAGDATGRGESGECENFLKWFGDLDFSHRIFIPGNHDFFFEREPGRSREMCEKYGVTLLIDENVVIDGVKIHGSPMTPFFYNWAFNRARVIEMSGYHGRFIQDHWKMIPDDTDILVTHGPAFGILDQTMRGEAVGCEELLKRIKKVKPDIHFFGHLHLQGGQQLHKDGTSFYNLSICDEMYIASNPVTVVEYEKDIETKDPIEATEEQNSPKQEDLFSKE